MEYSLTALLLTRLTMYVQYACLYVLLCVFVCGCNYHWQPLTVLLSSLQQWFPNFLGRDPKERLDVCPGPKLVKTADLQAHNVPLRVAL